MIDISLWRAVIGSWATRGISKENGTYTCAKMDLAMERMSYDYSKFMYSMYIMYYFLCIPYIALLLLCSGDVELNPGPTFIKCTSCFKVNSIRKLTCSCSQNLHKSSRQLTPKVSITLCNIAVKHAGIANVCTPNKCISSVSL